MHFYTREGEPRYFVEMKTRPGELRPTRTSDAKKEGWVPSVTTILNMLDKPALINWRIDQHLIQAYKSLPGKYKIPEYVKDEETYIRFIKDMTENEMDKAPKAGTDLHKLMEKYWPGEELAKEEISICKPIADAIIEKTGQAQFGVEERFSHPSGFAGMVDLFTDDWVIDYKTKQTADKFKPGKMAYPDHARQLAAYREGLGLPKANCANVFVCLENGEIDFHVHKEEDLQKGFATFMDCLSIWKRENYDSSWCIDTEAMG